MIIIIKLSDIYIYKYIVIVYKYNVYNNYKSQ